MQRDPENPVSLFARTTYRGDRTVFGIRQEDRRAHVYVIGQTGTGKSTLLETLILQDIGAGRGVALFDPHGDLVEAVRARIPDERQADLIFLDAANTARPLGFNPLESIPAPQRPLAASGILDVMKKIWADSWGPRMEHILRNALLTLLDQPEATLADLLKLFNDDLFRRAALARVANPQVRDFWLREYERYPVNHRAEAIAPIQNKVGAFLSNPILRGILVQPRSAFDLRRVIDDGKILLVNLAKGRIGADSAALLGALLVSSLGLAGLGRANIPAEVRRDFNIYLDEFHAFTTLSLAGMLSELRKYRVGLTLAHQYLTQLELPVRDAVLGNVGTMICFRIGLADAEVLGREFAPTFSAGDLISLPNHHIYLKLMIDGVVSRPFSAETLAPEQLDSRQPAAPDWARGGRTSVPRPPHRRPASASPRSSRASWEAARGTRMPAASPQRPRRSAPWSPHPCSRILP